MPADTGSMSSFWLQISLMSLLSNIFIWSVMESRHFSRRTFSVTVFNGTMSWELCIDTAVKTWCHWRHIRLSMQVEKATLKAFKTDVRQSLMRHFCIQLLSALPLRTIFGELGDHWLSKILVALSTTGLSLIPVQCGRQNSLLWLQVVSVKPRMRQQACDRAKARHTRAETRGIWSRVSRIPSLRLEFLT